MRDQEIHIGVSIGIAFIPDDGVNEDDLIRKTDVALYHAKRSGRGTYAVYTSQLENEE